MRKAASKGMIALPAVLAAALATIVVVAGCSPQSGNSIASNSTAQAKDTANAAPARPECDAPVALQVLGSGGPIADDARAGTSYLLRRDGVPVVLIDAGSGAFLRFAEAGASIAPLKAIVLSHYHGDHVSDLAAILNSGAFEKRTTALPIIGPAEGDIFPGLTAHLTSLFARDGGAFPYLSGYLTGANGASKLEITEVDTANSAAMTVFTDGDLIIEAIAVHHLAVPTLAYRITAGDAVVVFSADQSFLSDGFEAALAGSAPDMMVMHNAIPEGEGQPRGLHRSPSSWGEVAAKIQPRKLIIAHNMQRALKRHAEGLAAIRQHYDGPAILANDLDCFAISAGADGL